MFGVSIRNWGENRIVTMARTKGEFTVFCFKQGQEDHNGGSRQTDY